LVKSIQVEGAHATVILEVTTSDPEVARRLEEGVKDALTVLEDLNSLSVRVDVKAPMTQALQAGGGVQKGIEGIRHLVAVASGKGGVGKSTVAANLAAALAKSGWKVGLCDCDLYGPSMGLMFGTDERPTVTDDDKIEPVERHGLKLMSMSLLVEGEAPVILRGPMVTRYTQQFLRDVAWGELDVLILDLPPGTGDIQLTIVQTVALSGAVVVTTPQEVALIDARKAVKMFEKVNVPILGFVENMSYFLCPNDGNRYDIFGSGGGRREADKNGVSLLAQVPLEMSVRMAGDGGMPVVLADGESASAKEFTKAAESLRALLSNRLRS
jgi:ATP-binding protein involved in chromosome partitioning